MECYREASYTKRLGAEREVKSLEGQTSITPSAVSATSGSDLSRLGQKTRRTCLWGQTGRCHRLPKGPGFPTDAVEPSKLSRGGERLQLWGFFKALSPLLSPELCHGLPMLPAKPNCCLCVLSYKEPGPRRRDKRGKE
ncbi:unnamed protein product [Lepidochelys kempii]